MSDREVRRLSVSPTQEALLRRRRAQFGQMILNSGKLGNVRILSPKSVELMAHD
jgi:hypothetical protein